MATLLDQMEYTLTQGARMAWYGSHYAVAQRLAGPRTPPGEPEWRASGPIPSREALLASLRDLMARDWANIAQGIYAKPHDRVPDPSEMLANSIRFFRDMGAVDDRRLKRGHSEVNTDDRKGHYPRYYLQNFHFQTDGWLSETSARLYDTQVEVLFTGMADAMRRQVLVPLREAMAGRDQRTMNLVDVACGTGRFLTFVKDNYPRLNVTALDLSRDYLAQARRLLAPWSHVDFVEANAETMPFDDGSQDVLTSIYLFHELPPKVRRIVAKEMARVLKPGGTLIVADSTQYGDEEGWDALLEAFPVHFHEPYYMSYLSEDLPELFGEAGLTHRWSDHAFLTKVNVFTKP